MIKSFIFLIYIISAVFLFGCTSTPKKIEPPQLEEILYGPDVISFPLQTTAYGRWIVDLSINETHSMSMIVDTGATFSAVFDDVLAEYNLVVNTERTINVHGLIGNKTTPVTNVEQVGFGQDIYFDKAFAILPFHDGSTEEILPVDGVLGMDILKNYRIYVDRAASQIYFIPNNLPQVKRPFSMRKIELYSNPYSEIAPDLHFFTLSIRIKNVPSLLDTGNDVHVINWHASNFVEADAIKSRLKSQWKLSGAVGEFKPVVRVSIAELEAEQYIWEDVKMIIKDTDSLNILGVEEKPLIVAGVGLLEDRNVYIDFLNDFMWLEDMSGPKTGTTVLSICVRC